MSSAGSECHLHATGLNACIRARSVSQLLLLNILLGVLHTSSVQAERPPVEHALHHGSRLAPEVRSPAAKGSSSGVKEKRFPGHAQSSLGQIAEWPELTSAVQEVSRIDLPAILAAGKSEIKSALLATKEWYFQDPSDKSPAAGQGAGVQFQGEMTCGKEQFAPSSECPKECPFYAEDDKKFCNFACVKADECGTGAYTKEANIADKEQHQCRRCEVAGCRTCAAGKPGEALEICQECMPGYFSVDGGAHCTAISDFFFGFLVVVTVLISIFVIFWYLDLRSKPVVNEEGMLEAIHHRSRMKVRQATVDGRPLYPLSTNLLTENICGVGTLVFFRFQAVVIGWATMMFLLQIVLGLISSTDIFVIGVKEAEDPQEYCAVVQWGRRRQMELLWVKVLWIVVGYVTAFFGAVWYSVSCRRLFERENARIKTMTDFCCEMRGLPIKKGTDKWEETVKKAVEDATGLKIVGASVCWDFSDHHVEHHIMELLEKDVGGVKKTTRASQRGSVMMLAEGAASNDQEARGAFGRLCDSIASKVLETWGVHEKGSQEDGGKGKEEAGEEEEEMTDDKIVELLEGMDSTEFAMIVFNTEADRDKAFEKQGIVVDGATCTLTKQTFEPEDIIWEHMGIRREQLNQKMSIGAVVMGIAVVLWTVVLYAPYAAYLNSFTYKDGDEPGLIGKTVFIGIVIGAQIGLFVIANQITHHAGFHYEDLKQAAYIRLYNAALIVNLALDMTLTALLSYKIMTGRGVRTATGELLSDLPNLQEIFESYPMQKTIGAQLKEYSFPATFLLPFAAEPFCVLFFPYHVGCLFLKTTRGIVGPQAEKALQLPVMEQGRFADVIFNAILICLVPFIAPGYILILFGAFIFSHVYIYLYDHWRTLRCCTRYYFSSDVCNKEGERLWSIPCGLLLAGLIFKLNQMMAKKDPTTGLQTLGAGPLEGVVLYSVLTLAFVAHVAIHLMVLEHVVPMLDPKEGEADEHAEMTYEDCSKITPPSWFSTNPVWCLRSRYIYKHSPPQVFYLIGREHVLKKNESIGAYYECPAAVVEDEEKSSVI